MSDNLMSLCLAVVAEKEQRQTSNLGRCGFESCRRH